MREEKNLRTLRIDKSFHDKIKYHCDKLGIKIYKWVEDALKQKLENEKINNR